MKVYYEIQDMLEDELKKYCKQESISSSDVEDIYRMIDIVKDITTIEAMKRAEEEGYSRDYSYNSYDDYSYARRGRDGDGDGRYSEDNSYRRGRDSMGRYTSRDRGSSYRNSYRDGGYSGHTKEQMIEKLEHLMREASSEQERENIRKAIEQLDR